MFTRLIILFLTMWSSSSTLGMAIGTKDESHVERRAVEHLWALPASPPAVEMQQLSPKRFSSGIFIKDPFSANKKEDVEDRKFLFKYIEGSPQFESLNTEEYLKLVKDKEQHSEFVLELLLSYVKTFVQHFFSWRGEGIVCKFYTQRDPFWPPL
ncbi:hypothetical protein PGTUg99_009422 [Puccinia graminis f. sp. tritici]|uniref:Uncharacterized protein n=1 Tax=Puccinia graminis f. sp. tritici TaxID=56615 RepID=A0A5B0RCD6_PUCGR|nr:hypothetical protein PGTUg99_009422 [Puccinia graminis f. sp. tritici]